MDREELLTSQIRSNLPLGYHRSGLIQNIMKIDKCSSYDFTLKQDLYKKLLQPRNFVSILTFETFLHDNRNDGGNILPRYFPLVPLIRRPLFAQKAVIHFNIIILNYKPITFTISL